MLLKITIDSFVQYSEEFCFAILAFLTGIVFKEKGNLTALEAGCCIVESLSDLLHPSHSDRPCIHFAISSGWPSFES